MKIGRGNGNYLVNIVVTEKNRRAPDTCMVDIGQTKPSELSLENWRTMIGIMNSQRSNTKDKVDDKPGNLSSIIDYKTNNRVKDYVINRTFQNVWLDFLMEVTQWQSKSSSIGLNDIIWSPDVLYVPDLTCNLIFMSQLIGQTNLCVLYMTPPEGSLLK